MNVIKAIAIIATIAMLTMVIPVSTLADSTVDGNGAISIIDSRGVTTNLTQPAAHVASFGAFATNTLVDIGFLDTAVIFDAGSEYNKSAIPEMMNMSADKFITVSSGNKDAVIQTMLNLTDDGKWNKTSDVILGYGYNSYSAMWSELEGFGFNVITFYPNSYDGIVQVVEDIENIVGANHSISGQMTYLKEYIDEVLIENGVNDSSLKVTALYASYSSNTLKLGNNNSVTVDFINYAGGVNVAEDPDKASPSYAVDFSAILQLNPEYVLLDGYYTGSAEDFSALIGDSSINVYKMNKSWNSYCPDAMTGLWTVACLFYPDYFEGAIPNEPTHEGDNGIDTNTLIYAVGGVCFVLLVVGAVMITRRKGKRD
jgi:ABC-type Fe3+-hydroxamate transport system substrate-binding protein